MANTNTVCSMCGDIGFPEKLFRCIRCCSRFQHSYCTNYYGERTTGLCDWCLSEEKHRLQCSKKSAGRDGAGSDKVKENEDREETGSRSKSGASSSKPAGRRYKLLKDVLS
ncbi:hypothetical protein COCNU_10G003820 [Cocos nucifera]|uniref:PHD-type zinc finger plants domain-containing protein n=1 Tax=Cocos nucifera TaxID=13894 RepID=A0A8K0IN57_COCNU|nr:hypothetical protein COCNU_10G003820 [Cocos nucifera]